MSLISRLRAVVAGDDYLEGEYDELDYETGDGSCIRDYIHVSDLAEAHLLALDFLKRENQDLVANLGTSRGMSVLEILRIAREVSKTDFNIYG